MPFQVKSQAPGAVLLALAAILAAGYPAGVRGQDCHQHVRSTAESLEEAQRKAVMTSGQGRQRADLFLEDARKLLDEARAECDRATNVKEQGYAIAKALVAQGNVAAAQIFIKASPF